MKTVIADATLADELKKTTSPVEIVTAEGRSLGTFRPAPVRPFPEPAISDEELLRRETDPNAKWYTAAEVEAKMKEWRCSQ